MRGDQQTNQHWNPYAALQAGLKKARWFKNIHVLPFIKDIKHYFPIEAEQRMEQASYEGSQVDWVGQPGMKMDAVLIITDALTYW